MNIKNNNNINILSECKSILNELKEYQHKDYQLKYDDNLETENKQVVGAINEILDLIKDIDLSKYVTEDILELKGFLKEHQSLEDCQLKYDDNLKTENKKVIDAINEILDLVKDIDLNNYVTNEEIEDKKYLTSIPNEYITDDELDKKGFLTNHQSLEGLATEKFVKDEIDKIKPISDTDNYNNINNYIMYVNLEDWGIHDGFLDNREYKFDEDGNPLPKYTDEEWKIAYDNKYGIINALNYAKKNNYNTVVFPKSEIFICYEEKNKNVKAYYEYKKYPIIIPSGITLDLGGSIIKVIYDSHVTNPYDLSQHSNNNPIWKLSGTIFSFSQSYHSSIKNGTLVGDLYERAYDDGLNGFNSEKGFDCTTGICIEKGSSFINIEDMIIKGFMADAISSMTDHDPNKGNDIVNPQFKYQVNINNLGQEVPEKGSYSTDFLSIEKWDTRESIMRTNLGYTRVPSFKNPNFKVTYYDKDKNYLLQSTERYLQNILVPTKAKFIKLTILHEEYDKEVPLTFGIRFSPKAGEFCTIRNCELTENHRGGIANMINNTVIERCKIYNNANGHYEGYPIFPDSTRYAINCEDCLPLNLTVRDCYIYDTFHGILFAGNSITVENCIFKNIGYNCLNLYNCESANFTLNKIYNSRACVGNTESSVYKRYVNIYNNMLFDSGLVMNIKSTTHINYFINNNSIRGRFSLETSDNINLSNLIVDYQRQDNSYRTVNATLSNAKDITFRLNDGFISTASFWLSIDKKCKDIYIYTDELLNPRPPIYTGMLNNTFIDNANITIPPKSKILSNDTKKLILNGCELINPTLDFSNYMQNIEQYSELEATNTNFICNKSIRKNIIEGKYYNNDFYRNYCFILKNCKIENNDNSVSSFINTVTCKLKGKIMFENCEFINTSETNLDILNVPTNAECSELSLSFKGCKFEGNITKTNNVNVIVNEE